MRLSLAVSNVICIAFDPSGCVVRNQTHDARPRPHGGPPNAGTYCVTITVE